MYANGLYRTFAALAIAWAFILTFNTGCDINQPGDDDDIVGDDDDATDDFAATIETSLPNGLTGTIEIVNSTLLETCEDTDTCSAETTHTAGHTIEVESGLAYFEIKAFTLDTSDNDQILEFPYDENGQDWTMTPTGTYEVYDKPCDDPTGQLNGDVKEVTVDTSAVPFYLEFNDSAMAPIANDQFSDNEYVSGTVARDNSYIDYTDGWGSRCLRPVN